MKKHLTLLLPLTLFACFEDGSDETLSSSSVSSSSSSSSSEIVYPSYSFDYDTLLDARDGKSYRTIAIGSQVWMAQNLAHKADSGNSWWAENDSTKGVSLGRFYDWKAAMAGGASSLLSPSGVRGICPQGWHLPSDSEWAVLSQFLIDTLRLGGVGQAGVPLKANDSSWVANKGSNQSGFGALPAGFVFQSEYVGYGHSASFWSSSENNSTGAWARGLIAGSQSWARASYDKGYGFSVRCVRDSLAK